MPRCLVACGIPSPGATWEGSLSSRAQLAPEVLYERRSFERNRSISPRPQDAAGVACRNVLLVGRSGSWAPLLLKSLEKFGSELSVATPKTVTTEYVRLGAFDLVLLDSTVPSEQRRRLVSELAGSDVSLFYSLPVEAGCWWLPALRHGNDCHGAPAFRRSEFPRELERMLQDHAEA
jgi:hypothetical protein